MLEIGKIIEGVGEKELLPWTYLGIADLTGEIPTLPND